MKEQQDERLCSNRIGANSLQTEGGAHSRGHSFKKHLSVEMLNRGGRYFDGGALLEKYGGVGF